MMPGWFARVGLPLSPAENAAIGELSRIVAPSAPVTIIAIATWHEAATFVREVERDATWWDQEEEERERLWARAAEHRTEAEMLQYLIAVTLELDAQVRGAARAAVTAAGVADAAIASEATGMALLAAHQSALAGLVGEGRGHRFVRKFELFSGGRWPLGYHSARFAIF
jgi:hypothetical protein